MARWWQLPFVPPVVCSSGCDGKQSVSYRALLALAGVVEDVEGFAATGVGGAVVAGGDKGFREQGKGLCLA